MRKQRIIEACDANRVIPDWQKAAFFMVGLLSNVFFFIPLFAYFAYKKHKVQNTIKDIMQRTEEGLRKFAGSAPEHIDVSISVTTKNGRRLVSGGALAVANGKIYVVDEGIACELEHGEIRNWKWVIEGHTTYRNIGGGLSGNMSAAMATQESQVAAFGRSGFFVQVADIDKPEWHFVSDDKALLMKWGEIFTRLDERHASTLAGKENAYT